MDSTAALNEIRRLIRAHLDGEKADTRRLVVLMGMLDRWLTFGGRLPDPWYQLDRKSVV